MIVKVTDLRLGKIIYDYVFLDDYLRKDGVEDRRLTNSPHYKLLASYEKDSHLDLRRTDYYRFAKARLDAFGSWFGHKDEDGILLHMQEFLALFRKIRKEGFDTRRGKIMVYKAKDNAKHRDKMGRPHPKTSFYTPVGWEIHEGHHRAAIIAKLGYEQMDVDILNWHSVLKNIFKKHITSRLIDLSSA